MTDAEKLQARTLERLARITQSQTGEPEAGQSLADELTEARETIKRLNRRCQLAEAALEQKVETFEQRSKRALRAYYYNMGREDHDGKIAALTHELAKVQEQLRAIRR